MFLCPHLLRLLCTSCGAGWSCLCCRDLAYQAEGAPFTGSFPSDWLFHATVGSVPWNHLPGFLINFLWFCYKHFKLITWPSHMMSHNGSNYTTTKSTDRTYTINMCMDRRHKRHHIIYTHRYAYTHLNSLNNHIYTQWHTCTCAYRWRIHRHTHIHTCQACSLITNTDEKRPLENGNMDTRFSATDLSLHTTSGCSYSN